MAFSKTSAAPKRVHNLVQEDIHWRMNIDREEKNIANWRNRYGWLADEYDALHQQLTQLTESSELLKHINPTNKEEDRRNPKPFPITTNRHYGWLSTLPEFCLERYGPDVDRGLPLPPTYAIMKETFY